MKLEILVCDHQSRFPVPAALLVAMEKYGAMVAEYVRDEYLVNDDAPLVALECIEVALVDDSESDRVHREFMGIKGATDVITFDHGEVVIGVEVAKRQAVEYDEPALRELFRYLVHGILHLAGYDDQTTEERSQMESVQEQMITRFWSQLSQASGSKDW